MVTIPADVPSEILLIALSAKVLPSSEELSVSMIVGFLMTFKNFCKLFHVLISFRFKWVGLFLWSRQVLYRDHAPIILSSFSSITEDFCDPQLWKHKNFRFGHDSTGAFSARALVNFVFNQMLQFGFFGTWAWTLCLLDSGSTICSFPKVIHKKNTRSILRFWNTSINGSMLGLLLPIRPFFFVFFIIGMFFFCRFMIRVSSWWFVRSSFHLFVAGISVFVTISRDEDAREVFAVSYEFSFLEKDVVSGRPWNKSCVCFFNTNTSNSRTCAVVPSFADTSQLAVITTGVFFVFFFFAKSTMETKMIADRRFLFRPPFPVQTTGTLQKNHRIPGKCQTWAKMIFTELIIFFFFFWWKVTSTNDGQEEEWITLRLCCAVLYCSKLVTFHNVFLAACSCFKHFIYIHKCMCICEYMCVCVCVCVCVCAFCVCVFVLVGVCVCDRVGVVWCGGEEREGVVVVVVMVGGVIVVPSALSVPQDSWNWTASTGKAND